MTLTPYLLLAVSMGVGLYAYLGYPAILGILALVVRRRSSRSSATGRPGVWPSVTITIPVHNEAAVIAATLERILEVDYPVARRQILVVSDASTDSTDEIVARFATRGVEWLRLPERCGKTAAENAARSRLTGEIIVNTDASVRIHPQAIKELVAAFGDPTVGVASGRDVSVANVNKDGNLGEEAYVGYEMWVRELETYVHGIVGASGCLYAIRRDLHMHSMPDGLSRDFGAALVAREHGYRAVSVPGAICYVPRSLSLRREYRRKVRTMARGLRTLWYRRALLHPRRHGLFAWMLWSHKLCRWLVPWMLFPAAAALVVLAAWHWWAAAALVAGAAAALATAVGWLWPEDRPLPRWIAFPAYALSGSIAALQAWIKALGPGGTAQWEPTRRRMSGPHAGRASRPA